MRVPDIVYILLQNATYGEITSITRDIQLGLNVPGGLHLLVFAQTLKMPILHFHSTLNQN